MKNEIHDLLTELEASVAPTLAWTDTRQRIHDLHQKAETFEERGLLLKIYVTLMDSVEKMKLVQDVDKFRDTLKKDYNLLLISESTDGKHIVPAKLLAVTKREIEAGHIDEEHDLHKLALMGDHLQTPPAPKRGWLSRLLGR